MNNIPVLSREAIQAYDHLSLPVWLFAVKTLRILAANPAAQKWLGYDAETLLTMTIADLRPESDRRKIFDRVNQFNGATTEAGTWTIVAKSGDRYTTSFSWCKVVVDGHEAIVASIRDVTQIAHAETLSKTLSHENELLRHRASLSTEHLSRLFDGIPGKMVVLTPREYKIVAVTDEYSRAVMLGRDALLGQHLFDLFPDDPTEPEADGASNLRASLQRVEALRVTDVMNLQRYPVRKPDGAFEERFWLPRNKPVLDADGHIIYIVHRVEDMTEALEKEEDQFEASVNTGGLNTLKLSETRSALFALQERETRLKTAEMLMSLGAWEYDLDRDRLNWANRVFDIYGVSTDHEAPDFDGYVALVHPDDRDQMVSAFEEFRDSGASEIEFQHRILRADGTVAHIRGVGARHKIDRREVVIGFVQDFTSIKRAEEEQMLQAQRRRLAGHLARLGSWRVELGQTRISWDEETTSIHDEPIGTSPTPEQAISYYIPQHRERIRSLFETCITEGRSFDDTFQIRTAKGRMVWVRVIGEPVHDEHRQIVAIEGAFQDVTDLIAVRNEAEELSARLRRTLEGMSDAFFLLNDAWQFTFVNSQAETLLQRTSNQLLGRNVWQEFPEAVSSKFRREYERAVSEGCAVRFEEYFAPLETWFEVSADPTPAGLAVYFRDVTQHHARDMQLRLLETAVSHQNDILLITEAEPINGPDGPRIVYVNDAFERRTGFTRDEVIGQTPRILQGPQTQREELDRIRNALERWQPVRSQLINHTKSGEAFWLELDIVPLADETGWFTHWISVERDITERKQTELALQANEERFRLVAKGASSVIWDWDKETNQQWWSDGLQEIFGHHTNSSDAASRGWRIHVHGEDLPRVDAALEKIKSGRSDFMQEQYRFQRADGSWAIVEDKAFPLLDDDGNVLRILGSMTDISEQRQLEEQLRQSQKMETVGQLTGGVAHDFNNLLTIILSNSETLAEELVEQPHLRKLAKMSLEAAVRGAELTDRLLSFSRKQALEPKVLDVAQLVQGLDGLLRRMLPENISIEFVRSGGLWKIEVDAGQLEAALLNLAVNAHDAMPDGGCLTIEAANAMLDDDYAATEPDVSPGQYVVILVSDTGHGIPRDAVSQVFEPFFTTKEVGKGSGLGLSMVFGFVKQSGGHIRIYSEQGEGTTVKMYFPRSWAKRDSIVSRPLGLNVTGGHESILVVEDDRAVRENVTAQLRGLGYQVLEASTGADAMKILLQNLEIDLLFTDVVIPGGMGGRELAEAARNVRRGLKILFTSGYTENAIVHNGRLDPGIKLLSKPYRRKQLAAKIREILDE